jgi:hypothetical protein
LRSLRWRNFWLAYVAMYVLLLSTPALSQSGPASPPTQVRGEVLMLTSDLVVVKSADGTSILIPLGKDTTVDASLKVGDHVEVVATPDRQVTSVKKLTPDPLR